MNATQDHESLGGGTAVAPSASAACDVLYYDGQCPLCRREMQSLAAQHDDRLQLVDIHRLDDLPPGLTREHLLKWLHLRRADGQWVTGVDANVAAWEHTPRGRWLRWMRWPVLRHVVDAGYRVWALWRYRRLYGTG